MNLFIKYLVVVLMVNMIFPGTSNAGKKEYSSPESVAGAATVAVAEAKKLFDEGVVFIDVRNSRLFTKSHIPGAVHLDFKYSYDEQKLNNVASLDQPIVIYCSGVACSRSYRASEKAVSWGYTKVKYFRGGIVDWRKAGYITE